MPSRLGFPKVLTNDRIINDAYNELPEEIREYVSDTKIIEQD